VVGKPAARATKYMKPERPSENPEPVRGLLREWQITSLLPPRFAENVWRRIEGAERTATTEFSPKRWAILKTWLSVMLPRPAFAVSYVSLLLVAGLIGGYWHARIDTTSWEKTLAHRYVQAVDPFQKRLQD